MAELPEDLDPQETREWLDALEGVIAAEGPQRAHYLIEKLVDKARRRGAWLPFHATTAYDILRHNGVPLGKVDFIGGLPFHDG